MRCGRGGAPICRRSLGILFVTFDLTTTGPAGLPDRFIQRQPTPPGRSRHKRYAVVRPTRRAPVESIVSHSRNDSGPPDGLPSSDRGFRRIVAGLLHHPMVTWRLRNLAEISRAVLPRAFA